jgi:Tol biopolymer transport system component
MLRRLLLLAAALLSLGSTGGDGVWMVLRQGWPDPASALPAAAVSADGRYVAFVSAVRLTAADTNGLDDIYVLDRDTRELSLATVAFSGGAADGTSFNPQLNGDGRLLAFDSRAATLTDALDRNEKEDIFVRDRVERVTRRVSIGPGGEDANGRSVEPALSTDGRWLVFQSTATNLVPGGDLNGTGSDIFLADLSTGTLTRISVDTAGRQFARAYSPRISSDGGLVVFAATRTVDTGAGRTGVTAPSVYLRDVAARTTTCISCARGTSDDDLAAFGPDLSADGRIVAFTSQTAPGRTDIVVHDRGALVTSVITRRANAQSTTPRLSGDGNVVAFESWASNLLCRGRCQHTDIDDNLLPDVYLFDRRSESFRRASGVRGTWWAPSLRPAIDGRGQVVVFSSREPFGPEDLTSDFDLFVCSPVCS